MRLCWSEERGGKTALYSSVKPGLFFVGEVADMSRNPDARSLAYQEFYRLWVHGHQLGERQEREETDHQEKGGELHGFFG